MDVTVRLAEIDEDNWEEIVLLTTREDGIPVVCEQYVASNALSICQAVYEEEWVTKAIYCGKKAVGFTMFGYNQKTDRYEICRLMIDYRHQGKGFGSIALSLVIDEMIDNYEDCYEIYLSVNPGNDRAKHIYRRAGFQDIGEKNGSEDIYCLYLDM